MSAAFTNRFILCKNEESSEVTLEFFMEEPIFAPSELKIQSSSTTSVSKLIMSKNCAENLCDTLSNMLKEKQDN